MDESTLLITTTAIPNVTSVKEPPVSVYIGFITLMITVVIRGSFMIPAKSIETGNGIFFHFFLSLGMWTSSFLINCILGFPEFYALSMISGMTWSGKNKFKLKLLRDTVIILF